MSLSRRSSFTSSPVVLTIAGSDSSGGAGIQADLKTFTALQCYGASVITALTAQNTVGIDAIHPTPPSFITQQLHSVLTDMRVSAFKTGMLYDAGSIHAIAKVLKERFHYMQDGREHRRQAPLVVDPVCVSTSGHVLLAADAMHVLATEVLPLATIVTPNKAEAEMLLSVATTADDKPESTKIDNIEDAVQAARTLHARYGCSVLLKGGHLTVTIGKMREFSKSVAVRGDVKEHIHCEWEFSVQENMEILATKRMIDPHTQLVVDVLYEHGDGEEGKCTVFARPRIQTTCTHGTGCTLSAAIACYLARGASVEDAVRSATEYTHLAIQSASPLGKGHGPLNHLHALSTRLVTLPSKADPYPFTRLLIHSNAGVWKEYVQHQFVRQLGAGVLRRECFLHFIKQDYQYLKYYARAYGLLVAKSRSFADIKPASETIQAIIREVSMHSAYCSGELGISEPELEDTPESQATVAYGAFLLDVGLSGDDTKLIVALAACLLGYGEVGLWLMKEAQRPGTWVRLDGNPYLRWIEDYSGDRYQNAVRTGLDLLELAAREDPPSPRRLAQWKEVWGRCMLLEKQFWDMAMNLS